MTATPQNPIEAAQQAYDGLVRKARSELTQAQRVAAAASLVHAAAEARVADTRRVLWQLGVDPDEDIPGGDWGDELPDPLSHDRRDRDPDLHAPR